jgi:hypothetical protein
LPKNDHEPIVPLPDWTAQLVQVHTSNNPPRAVNLLFRWTDGRPLRARLYDEVVWKPASE